MTANFKEESALIMRRNRVFERGGDGAGRAAESEEPLFEFTVSL